MMALAEAMRWLSTILVDGAENRDVRFLHDNALPGDQNGRIAQWSNLAGSGQTAAGNGRVSSTAQANIWTPSGP
jgi:hypothetical protein